MNENRNNTPAQLSADTTQAVPALELKNITKSYADGKEMRTVLNDVSLSVYPGELAAIVGPSGCGKSTLLNIAGMMQSPDSGSVILSGTDTTSGKKRMGKEPASSTKRAWTKLRRDHIGFIFQSHQLLPYLRGEDQLDVVKKISSSDKEKLLKELDLTEIRRQYPGAMSGGERQRFAVARAFAANPDVILADEPTAALDSVRGRKVVSMIADEVHSRGKAAIMVTHDSRVLDLADTVYRMEDGKLVKER